MMIQYLQRQEREDCWFQEKRNWRKCIAEGLVLLEGRLSLNSPFPKHFPYHPIFGFFLFKLLHFWGFSFYTMLWFLQSWITPDSHSPALRLSWKTTVHIYDKNTTKNPQKLPFMPHLRSWWLPPLNANVKMKRAIQGAWISRLFFKRCHLLSKSNTDTQIVLSLTSYTPKY